MSRLALAVFSLLSVLGTSGAAAASLAPPQTQAFGVPSKILSIRGGAGPIEPTAAAKTIGGLLGVSGALCALSPNFFAEAYGMSGDLNDTNIKMMRRIGVTMSEAGLLAYLLLFRKDCDFNTAMGIASVPWAAEALSSLLDGDANTIGPSKHGDLSILAFSGAAAFAGLTKADWATNVFKAASIFTIFSGIPCLLNAEFAAKLWEIKGGDKFTNGLINFVGANLINVGALWAALAWNIEPAKAFGYAALVSLAIQIKCNFLSSDADVLDIDTKLLVSWPVLSAVVAASILIE